MTKRKSFSPEFKREAVRLLQTSQKVPADLARNWGRVFTFDIGTNSGSINVISKDLTPDGC